MSAFQDAQQLLRPDNDLDILDVTTGTFTVQEEPEPDEAARLKAEALERWSAIARRPQGAQQIASDTARRMQRARRPPAPPDLFLRPPARRSGQPGNQRLGEPDTGAHPREARALPVDPHAAGPALRLSRHVAQTREGFAPNRDARSAPLSFPPRPPALFMLRRTLDGRLRSAAQSHRRTLQSHLESSTLKTRVTMSSRMRQTYRIIHSVVRCSSSWSSVRRTVTRDAHRYVAGAHRRRTVPTWHPRASSVAGASLGQGALWIASGVCEQARPRGRAQAAAAAAAAAARLCGTAYGEARAGRS